MVNALSRVAWWSNFPLFTVGSINVMDHFRHICFSSLDFVLGQLATLIRVSVIGLFVFVFAVRFCWSAVLMIAGKIWWKQFTGFCLASRFCLLFNIFWMGLMYKVMFRPLGSHCLVCAFTSEKRSECAQYILQHGLGKWARIIKVSSFWGTFFNRHCQTMTRPFF